MQHPHTQTDSPKAMREEGQQHAIQEILVLHHSHFDLGYTHSQPIVEELQREFIDQTLDLLDQTEDYPAESAPKWTCEVTWPVLRWLETAGDRRVEQFRSYMQQGRLAIGGWLCSTTPLCTAEQLAEQLYPMRRLREQFGVSIRFAMQHDVNGMPWPAVDLMLDAGIELFVMATNAHTGGKIDPCPGPFRWIGPSGRSLLTFNGSHYSMFDQFMYTWNGDLDAMRRGWDECVAHLGRRGYGHDFVYLTATHPPQAWDNSPPNPRTTELIRQWNETEAGPPIRYVTPVDLFERLKQVPDEQIAAIRGDWTDYWNFGCASTAVETQVARDAQVKVFSADLLRAATGADDPAIRRVRDRVGEALNLWTEHTWGAWSSADMDCPNTRAQLQLKKQYAYTADASATYLLVDALERLAGNPKASQGPVEAVLVVNASPIEYVGPVAVPTQWSDDATRIRRTRFDFDALHHAVNHAPLAGPVTAPAFGYAVVPLDQLEPYAADTPVRVGQTPPRTKGEPCLMNVLRSEAVAFIESPTHRLQYHAATGRILSLVDKATGWEVLDRSSPYTLFEYIRERPDPLIDGRREAIYERDLGKEKRGDSCWHPDWRAVRERPTCLIEHRVEATGARATLVLRFEAPGVDKLEQRITLHAHTPRIDLEVVMSKPDIRGPEATYFALPLNLAEGWRAHFDTAGVPTELDAEQLQGSCRGWMTCERFASMHDASHGATLLTGDAPMVQFGDFNFGRERRAIDRSARPTLLAWALSNYWNTNFPASQPGLIRLRYGLLTHGAWDTDVVMRCSAQAAQPPQVHPVMRCSVAGAGRLIELDGRRVHLLHVKPADDGRGVIVRLLGLDPDKQSVGLRLGGVTVNEAWLSSTLEEDGPALPVVDGRAELTLNPGQITTLRLT